MCPIKTLNCCTFYRPHDIAKQRADAFGSVCPFVCVGVGQVCQRGHAPPPAGENCSRFWVKCPLNLGKMPPFAPKCPTNFGKMPSICHQSSPVLFRYGPKYTIFGQIFCRRAPDPPNIVLDSESSTQMLIG